MAAVAVPKFFSMQEDAKEAVINGALAEGAARFNHAFAKYILEESRTPLDIAALQTDEYLGPNADGTDGGESIGDFNLKWEKVGTDGLTITVLSCETISDLTGLTVAKTVSGVDWYVAP